LQDAVTADLKKPVDQPATGSTNPTVQFSVRTGLREFIRIVALLAIRNETVAAEGRLARGVVTRIVADRAAAISIGAGFRDDIAVITVFAGIEDPISARTQPAVISAAIRWVHIPIITSLRLLDGAIPTKCHQPCDSIAEGTANLAVTFAIGARVHHPIRIVTGLFRVEHAIAAVPSRDCRDLTTRRAGGAGRNAVRAGFGEHICVVAVLTRLNKAVAAERQGAVSVAGIAV
jgi:hypothetical protein